MNPQEIFENLKICREELIQANEELHEFGEMKAEVNKKYKMSLTREIFKLRESNCPMAIIHELAEGTEVITNIKKEKEKIENNYTGILYRMERIKLEIDILRSQLAWLKVELNNS